MYENFSSALKNFEHQLLEALTNNDKKAVLNIYGSLCVFEYKTITSKYSKIRELAYKAQSVKEKASDFLML